MVGDEVLAVVEHAAGRSINVRSNSSSADRYLVELGFEFDPEYEGYKLKVFGQTGEEKRAFIANVLSKLRDAGYCFSVGKDWSPSEVFEYFRELGLLSGKYKRIAWKNRQEYSVLEL